MTATFDLPETLDVLERTPAVLGALLRGTSAALRRANLEIVRGWRLTDAQLDLPGRHPEFGAVDLRQR